MDQISKKRVRKQGREGIRHFIARKEFTSPNTNPILPPESWENIFKNLPFTDLITVINTCPEWRHLFLERRTTILLPSILPILLQYLQANDILLLRRVNKHFKGEIDNVLQQYSRNPLMSIDRDPVLGCWEGKTSSLSVKTYRVERNSYLNFLSNYQKLNSKFPTSAQGNPFLTGHFYSQIDWNAVPNAKPLFSSLMTNFGVNISSFHFSVLYFNDRNTSILFAALDGKLPNLKKLRLTGKVLQPAFELFRNQPSSKLEHLEALDLSNLQTDQLPDQEQAFSPFVALFERYGSQLKMLHVGEQAFDFPQIDVEFLNTNFANLHFLGVEVNPNIIEKLVEVNWSNLHQLAIIRIWQLCKSSFADLLKLFTRFASDLTYLRVECPNISTGKLDPKMFPMLPKLIKFSAPMLTGIQAWLWCFLMFSGQNLEELEIILNADWDNMFEVRDEVDATKRAFDLVSNLKRIIARPCKLHKKYVLHRNSTNYWL